MMQKSSNKEQKSNYVLLIVDMQEKLVPHLNNHDKLEDNILKLIKSLIILNVNIISTEQYPKGLGTTIKSIKGHLTNDAVAKNTFSSYKSNEVKLLLQKLEPSVIILAGCESHICILQTALDLLNNGHQVYVVSDCVSSRANFDHQIALQRLKSEGVTITTTESIILEICSTSDRPEFKQIINIIK